MNPNPLTGFLEEVEVLKIRPSMNPLRQSVSYLEELMASIEEKGLLHPIVVRPVEGGFEVVAGNRRFEACRRLKWNKIPCHVVELDDKDAFEISLAENVQHKTLDPTEEAEAFKRYVDDFGWGGVSELAKRISKSEQYVSQRLQLLKLPGEVLEKITRRLVNPSQAIELVGLGSEDQIRLAEIVVKERIPSKEVRRMVKHLKGSHELDESSDLSSKFSSEDRKTVILNRTLDRCVASLRMTLIRFDDILDGIDEDEWITREMLMQYRRSIHMQIDSLLSLKKKMATQQR